jgi:RNA polymerase-binding transcription factor DksA
MPGADRAGSWHRGGVGHHYAAAAMSDTASPLPPTADRVFDRAVDLPRLERVGQDLAAVEAALVRLDHDTYGRCARCGEQIDDARLAVSPAADDCGAHGD